MIEMRFGDVLNWRTQNGLATSAFCTTHNKVCQLPSLNKDGKKFRVEAAGATCTPFSVAGQHLQAMS